MKTLKIEVRNTEVKKFQEACIKKGIRLGRLNWEQYGDYWSVTNFNPIDHQEATDIQSIIIK
jgi:hypothetical protein